MSDRDTSLPMPASGGSYLRDPETGALTPVSDVPVEEVTEPSAKPTAKRGATAPEKEG